MFKTQKGFTLVEIMIAVALLGGLSLVFMNITKQTAQVSKKFQTDTDADFIMREIAGILSDPTTCGTNNFNGQPFASVPAGTIIDIKDKTGVSKYPVASATGFGSSNIKVASYTISNANPVLDTNTETELLINFAMPKIVNANVATIKPRRIKLTITKTGANIASCKSSWVNSQDYWTKGTGANINDVYYNSGNVGIGTATPASPLSVGGPGWASAAIYGYSSTSGGYGVFGNTGSAAGGHGVSGTNTSATGVGVYGTATAGTGVIGNVGGTGNGVTGMASSGTGVTGSASTTGIGGYFSSGSGYALITGTGNVGIGTPTPGYTLQVGGTGITSLITGPGNAISAYCNTATCSSAVVAQTMSTTSPALSAYSAGGGTSSAIYAGSAGSGNTVHAVNSGTAIALYGQGNGGGVKGVGGGSAFGGYFMSGGNGIGGYFTSTSGYALITGTGNVGIGTTTPDKMLSVIGEGRFGGTVYLGTDATHNWGNISYSADIGGGEPGVILEGDPGNGVLIRGNGGGANSLIVKSSGYVGIGTSAPMGKVHISAADGTPALLLQNTSFTGSGIGSIMLTQAATGGLQVDQYGWWNLMNLAGSTGNLWIRGALTQNSDIRLKTDIEAIPNVLSKLERIDGVYFNWKDAEIRKAQGHQIGVIAQQIEKEFPELVKEIIPSEKNSKLKTIKTVDYSHLSAVILQAVKELYAKFMNQDRATASMKAENAKLKTRADKAEKENAAIKTYLCSKDPRATICQ